MKKSSKKEIEKLLVANVRPQEMKFVKAIVKILKKCKGKENSITNEGIRQRLYEKFGDLPEAYIRRYINYIRIHHLLDDVIACRNGYFVATTDEEVTAYVKTLRNRALSILCVMESYEV
jgi:hypothetical protein